jgi:hypothetical protein
MEVVRDIEGGWVRRSVLEIDNDDLLCDSTDQNYGRMKRKRKDNGRTNLAVFGATFFHAV